MSYTFSRRDFMKYSAVAAVAVAGSSMFTGCSLISNPNRPTGKTGDTLKPGSKICNATLTAPTYTAPTYTFDSATGSFKCHFKIYTQVSLQISSAHFQVEVTDADGKVSYYNNNGGKSVLSMGKVDSNSNYDAGKTVEFDLTASITIPNGTTKVQVVYLPKLVAQGKPSDAYSDIYATWDVTEDIKNSFATIVH